MEKYDNTIMGKEACENDLEMFGKKEVKRVMTLYIKAFNKEMDMCVITYFQGYLLKGMEILK